MVGHLRARCGLEAACLAEFVSSRAPVQRFAARLAVDKGKGGLPLGWESAESAPIVYGGVGSMVQWFSWLIVG